MECSVVIPTFDRPDTLARALEHLERQSCGAAAFEVLICVDSADREARDGVEGVLGRRPYDARVLASPRRGASAARNAGWRAARARLVLFLGDDTLAETELVAEHLAWHRQHPSEEAAVLGHIRWADEIRATPFLRWLDRGIQFDYGSIDGEEAGWGRLYSSNVSFKRAFVERLGGFDEELPYLYEDLDLGYRANEQGLRLLYNPRARAEHLHEPTVEGWRERMRIAAVAEARFVAKHPDVEPYFFNLFSAAARAPERRGRSAVAARFVPRWVPLVGPYVWRRADMAFRREFAPAFLEAWEGAAGEGG